MYRPRSRSPEYRQRRYSPSRPRSPSPPRPPRPVYDNYPPRDDQRYPGRSEAGHYPPPPRRYEYDAPRYRDRDHSPPVERYRDDHYGNPSVRPYERSNAPPLPYDQERYPPSVRGARDDYQSSTPPFRPTDAWRPERRDVRPQGGLAADREAAHERPASTAESSSRTAEPIWERGHDQDQIDPANDPVRDDSRLRKKGPSEPSKDVIFLGLDPELTEKDFMGFLKVQHQIQPLSVKVVMDKATGRSKSFGFVNFETVSDAEDFLNANYPAILMPALYEHSDPRKVKIDFAVAQSNSAAQDDYNQAPQYHARPGHDGMRDIGAPSPGQRVILLRSLNYSARPKDVLRRLSQEIARLAGCSGEEQEVEKAICRVVLVVDRAAGSSWGYAFVELATAELAAALVPFLLSPEKQPHGFEISGYPVAASFANLSSFLAVPADAVVRDHTLRASKSGGIGSNSLAKGSGRFVSYWHEGAGVSEAAPIGAVGIDEEGTVGEIPADLKKLLGSLAGAPTNPSSQHSSHPMGLASSGPISISIGGINPISIGSGKTRKREEEGFKVMPSKIVLDDEEEDMVGTDSVLLSRTKGVASIIAPSSRKTAKNISRWNTKKTELYVPEEPAKIGGLKLSEANAAIGPPRTDAQPIKSSIGSPSTSAPVQTDEYDYTDTSTLATIGKVACLLCQRQFKTEEVLRKHVAQSDLHKTNLLDEATRAGGVQRKKAALTKANDLAQAYRDRAAERREVHHQPDKPTLEDTPSNPFKRKFAEGPKPPPPPPPPALEPGQNDANVGNQLLSKMGWKTGTGLGLSGDGRVDPVLVQQFENRAGLGASKGHDASKWQGPGGFQQRALDMAKERYHGSSSGGGS